MGAYFDNAATSFPKPESVYQFMDEFYRKHGGNSGRGQYKLAAEASRIVSETRKKLQNLFQCENKDVIFAPSATIALNMVIQGVIAGGARSVYITPFEHNAVTRTLHHFEKMGEATVRKLALSTEGQYQLDQIQRDFEKNPPEFVIMSHASNVCGLIAPVEEIATLAKKYHAVTLLDMAQTAGLVPLNVGSQLFDFAVFAGHKTLYGPFGIGVFVKNRELSLEPVLFGGTGIESALQEMPVAVPARYEMGSQNIQAVAGLYAALCWFEEHAEAIREKERKNHNRLEKILRSHDNIRIVGPKKRDNCIGVVSCVFDGYSSDNIGDVLDRFEIAVRTGLHCAPTAHEALGTFPAGTVRFSVGFFTDETDFATLEDALDYIEENS